MLFPIEWHYLLTFVFCTSILLYWTSDSFRYHLRLYAYYVYFLIIPLATLPFMLANGRNRKNIPWCRMTQKLSGWLFGLHSKVINEENLITDGPSVVVSNHQSALDVTGMGKLFSERSTTFVKKQLLYTGTFGLGIWLSGFVFVDRSKKIESQKVLAKVVKEINKDGLCVWIFPEGTRNMSDDMLPFKKGAFNLAVKSQVPIVPVVFSSYKKFFNPEHHRFTSGKYIIKVLPPVPTKNLTLEDVPKLADDVRLEMMKAFKQISAEDYDIL